VTHPVKQRPHIADADYYRLGYQLAAQLLNMHATASTGPAPPGTPVPEHDDALDVAEQLLRDARTMIGWWHERSETRLRWRRPAPHEYRLRTFLVETIEPCCALIAARRLLQLGREDEAQPHLAHVLRHAREGTLSYRAYYSLACLQANTADADGAIASLGRALHGAPRDRRQQLAEWALSDPAFASIRAQVQALAGTEGTPPDTAKAPRGA
jgi:hypothetical protein